MKNAKMQKRRFTKKKSCQCNDVSFVKYAPGADFIKKVVSAML